MKAYHKKTKTYIDIESVNTFNRTGKTETREGVRCAVLKKPGSNEHYLVPWDNLVFLKIQGEKNVSAKLKTIQVRQMIVDFYTQKGNKITRQTLATKYGVSVSTVSDILNGKAWHRVSIPTIRQCKSGNANVLNVVKATNTLRNSKLKLNENMAKFIVRDHYLNKFKVKDLATKFCVSVRSIQRIVTGKAWASVTVPAIAQFKNVTPASVNAFGLAN